MRAAPLGLYLAERPELLETVRLASSVTHGHPLGIDGGVVLALATAQALRDERDIGELIAACSTEEFRTRLGAVEACLARRPEPRELAREFGRSIRALDSAVTALVAAWLHEDDTFEKLIAYCMAIGGDTDTIAAMAGGIYGARRGLEALPAAWLAKLENRANLDADAQALARRMSRRDEPDRYALEAVHAIDGAWRTVPPSSVHRRCGTGGTWSPTAPTPAGTCSPSPAGFRRLDKRARTPDRRCHGFTPHRFAPAVRPGDRLRPGRLRRGVGPGRNGRPPRAAVRRLRSRAVTA